jgi:Ca-activated chloride channel family protein
MRAARRIAVGCAALLAAPPLAGGQAPPGQPPVFSVDTDIVNLTISVRDLKGRLVSDLSADEFALREDGRPQKVQFFARAFEPGQDQALALDLGLLLDTSESMIEELKLSQEAAARFLESIPRARDLLTIFFDQDIRLSRYDSEHQQGLVDRIFESKGAGMTALYDAIAVYLSRVQDSSGRKVLVVFTDGEDTTSALSIAELMALVRSSGVTIYPIAFTGSFAMGSNRALSARSFLQHLADLSGGEVFTPHNSKDLPQIYAKILDELQSQYVIGFTSDNAKHDGKYRKLKVEVRRPGLKVRYRPGYTAPKDQVGG